MPGAPEAPSVSRETVRKTKAAARAKEAAGDESTRKESRKFHRKAEKAGHRNAEKARKAEGRRGETLVHKIVRTAESAAHVFTPRRNRQMEATRYINWHQAAHGEIPTTDQIRAGMKGEGEDGKAYQTHLESQSREEAHREKRAAWKEVRKGARQRESAVAVAKKIEEADPKTAKEVQDLLDKASRAKGQERKDIEAEIAAKLGVSPDSVEAKGIEAIVKRAAADRKLLENTQTLVEKFFRGIQSRLPARAAKFLEKVMSGAEKVSGKVGWRFAAVSIGLVALHVAFPALVLPSAVAVGITAVQTVLAGTSILSLPKMLMRMASTTRSVALGSEAAARAGTAYTTEAHGFLAAATGAKARERSRARILEDRAQTHLHSSQREVFGFSVKDSQGNEQQLVDAKGKLRTDLDMNDEKIREGVLALHSRLQAGQRFQEGHQGRFAWKLDGHTDAEISAVAQAVDAKVQAAVDAGTISADQVANLIAAREAQLNVQLAHDVRVERFMIGRRMATAFAMRGGVLAVGLSEISSFVTTYAQTGSLSSAAASLTNPFDLLQRVNPLSRIGHGVTTLNADAHQVVGGTTSTDARMGYDTGSHSNTPDGNQHVSGTGGCFVAGTLITMADGSQKAIEFVTVGEMVMSYDEHTKQTVAKKVLSVVNPLNTRMVTITFANGVTTTNTVTHPYYIVGKGWASYDPAATKEEYSLDVEKLEAEDIAYAYTDGKLVEVAVKELVPHDAETQTYNLATIEDTHTFFANGMLVHNKNTLDLRPHTTTVSATKPLDLVNGNQDNPVVGTDAAHTIIHTDVPQNSADFLHHNAEATVNYEGDTAHENWQQLHTYMAHGVNGDNTAVRISYEPQDAVSGHGAAVDAAGHHLDAYNDYKVALVTSDGHTILLPNGVVIDPNDTHTMITMYGADGQPLPDQISSAQLAHLLGVTPDKITTFDDITKYTFGTNGHDGHWIGTQHASDLYNIAPERFGADAPHTDGQALFSMKVAGGYLDPNSHVFHAGASNQYFGNGNHVPSQVTVEQSANIPTGTSPDIITVSPDGHTITYSLDGGAHTSPFDLPPGASAVAVDGHPDMMQITYSGHTFDVQIVHDGAKPEFFLLDKNLNPLEYQGHPVVIDGSGHFDQNSLQSAMGNDNWNKLTETMPQGPNSGTGINEINGYKLMGVPEGYQVEAVSVNGHTEYVLQHWNGSSWTNAGEVTQSGNQWILHPLNNANDLSSVDTSHGVVLTQAGSGQGTFYLIPEHGVDNLHNSLSSPGSTYTGDPNAVQRFFSGVGTEANTTIHNFETGNFNPEQNPGELVVAGTGLYTVARLLDARREITKKTNSKLFIGSKFLSGAAVGAGVGTMVAGPLGTVVGGVAGAGITSAHQLAKRIFHTRMPITHGVVEAGKGIGRVATWTAHHTFLRGRSSASKPRTPGSPPGRVSPQRMTRGMAPAAQAEVKMQKALTPGGFRQGELNQKAREIDYTQIAKDAGIPGVTDTTPNQEAFQKYAERMARFGVKPDDVAKAIRSLHEQGKLTTAEVSRVLTELQAKKLAERFAHDFGAGFAARLGIAKGKRSEEVVVAEHLAQTFGKHSSDLEEVYKLLDPATTITVGGIATPLTPDQRQAGMLGLVAFESVLDKGIGLEHIAKAMGVTPASTSTTDQLIAIGEAMQRLNLRGDLVDGFVSGRVASMKPVTAGEEALEAANLWNAIEDQFIKNQEKANYDRVFAAQRSKLEANGGELQTKLAEDLGVSPDKDAIVQRLLADGIKASDVEAAIIAGNLDSLQEPIMVAGLKVMDRDELNKLAIALGAPSAPASTYPIDSLRADIAREIHAGHYKPAHAPTHKAVTVRNAIAAAKAKADALKEKVRASEVEKQLKIPGVAEKIVGLSPGELDKLAKGFGDAVPNTKEGIAEAALDQGLTAGEVEAAVTGSTTAEQVLNKLRSTRMQRAMTQIADMDASEIEELGKRFGIASGADAAAVAAEMVKRGLNPTDVFAAASKAHADADTRVGGTGPVHANADEVMKHVKDTYREAVVRTKLSTPDAVSKVAKALSLTVSDTPDAAEVAALQKQISDRLRGIEPDVLWDKLDASGAVPEDVTRAVQFDGVFKRLLSGVRGATDAERKLADAAGITVTGSTPDDIRAEIAEALAVGEFDVDALDKVLKQKERDLKGKTPDQIIEGYGQEIKRARFTRELDAKLHSNPDRAAILSLLGTALSGGATPEGIADAAIKAGLTMDDITTLATTGTAQILEKAYGARVNRSLEKQLPRLTITNLDKFATDIGLPSGTYTRESLAAAIVAKIPGPQAQALIPTIISLLETSASEADAIAAIKKII